VGLGVCADCEKQVSGTDGFSWGSVSWLGKIWKRKKELEKIIGCHNTHRSTSIHPTSFKTKARMHKKEGKKNPKKKKGGKSFSQSETCTGALRHRKERKKNRKEKEESVAVPVSLKLGGNALGGRGGRI